MQYGLLIVLVGMAIFGVAIVLARKRLAGDWLVMDGIDKLRFFEVLFRDPTIKWWTRLGLFLFLVGAIASLIEDGRTPHVKSADLQPKQFSFFLGATA